MEACVHRMLYARLYNLSSVDVSLSGLWPKAELGSTHGIDLVYSILSQNGTLIRPASTRFVIGLQSHACSWNRFVQVSLEEAGSMEEAGSGHEDSSHTLTLDALQFCLVPGNPGVVSMRYSQYIRDLHTYIHYIHDSSDSLPNQTSLSLHHWSGNTGQVNTGE
jgi:hypothetical protein